MKKTLLTLLIVPLFALAVSCKKKGPAEEMGEKIDDAVEEVSDAVEP